MPSQNETNYFAHELACVEPGASIGSGSKIWHFAHVMPSAKIGSGCQLGQNVFVGNHVIIGDHVKIQNNVSVYEGVTLEDYVFCGPSMTFTNILTPRSAFPRNSSEFFSKTHVKRGASIGANATIVCGITLGEWCLIAAGAVVTKDVPPFALMAGVPAKRIGWVCACGIKLEFQNTITETACHECGRKYEMSNESKGIICHSKLI
jgi:UDP-2-acetamido-3-amino-2,3-dideoxy-glucuronate N-acetyltransferase